jgi:hypothetical protein
MQVLFDGEAVFFKPKNEWMQGGSKLIDEEQGCWLKNI